MTDSFDLTRERWIPVEALDGTVRERSTREVLWEAHLLRGLCDGSPLVIAALTRHLLAVLHRVYSGPKTLQSWAAIVSEGRFDGSRVDAYLDTVADRMNLFHPTRPFGQVRGLAQLFAEYTVPIDELEVVRSEWGSGRSLFRHRPASPPPTMSPARAARALLAHHAFVVGGLIRKPGEPDAASAAPLVRAGVVILRGATLFETLVSNLLKYDPEEGLPIPTGGQTDAPSWEQPPLPDRVVTEKEPRRSPYGYLDLLTWLSRRVELIQRDGVVSHFVNAVGQGITEPAPRDPMVTYRRDKEGGWVSLGINPERSFWRDANALFETGRTDDVVFRRPHAIALVANDAQDVVPKSRLYAVEVFGIAAVKSRIDAVRVERVHSRARSFDDAAAGEAVRTALGRANEVVKALQSALWQFAKIALSQGQREPEAEDIKGLTRSLNAEEEAWSALGVAFEQFMEDLASDVEASCERFSVRATRIIREVFRAATRRPGESVRWLQASVVAERRLNELLAVEGEPARSNARAEGTTP